MEIQGKVILKTETKTYGDNGFRKRELVIETDEQYPQKIQVEFLQDKTELIEKYKIGDIVKIGINIGGREWVNPQGETKYFNSITGWRVDAMFDKSKLNETHQKATPAPTNNVDDDLPF